MKRYLGWVYYILDDYFFFVYSWLSNIFSPRPPRTWQSGSKETVVLLPGLLESWVHLKKIGDFLNSQGYKIIVLHYSTLKPFKVCENNIRQHLQELTSSRLLLVGHSKGGLLVRSLLQDKDILSRTTHAICLCTPHNGSRLAQIMPGHSELSPGSFLISSLPFNPSICQKITNIYPIFDNHIWPQTSLWLKGAKNIKLPVIGHMRLLKSNCLMDQLTEELS